MENNDTICRTCLRLREGLCDGEKEQTACPWYKRMTNADRIRQMTDDELATLFIKVMAGNSGAQLDGIWQEKGMEENQRYFTRLNWLDWLKREVTGNG